MIMSALPTSRPFGTLPGGAIVEAWTLCGDGGLVLEALTYGGIIRRLVLPDGTDVVLGLTELDRYIEGHPFFGAITGRVAGRIAGAQFTLDGATFRLPANEPPHHLHGGPRGFDKQLWAATPEMLADGSPSLRLHYISPDGDQGYPGELDVTVRYSLRKDNAVVIETIATTSKATPVSVMNHSYFNLAGEGRGDILDHELQVFASQFVPVGEGFVPRDRLCPVDGLTDLRAGRLLRDAVPGFDHLHGPLYATGTRGGEALLVGRVVHAPSGRVLECWTNAPYLQVYTASHLPTHYAGKSGWAYGQFAGLCLECEGYPNGVNAPQMGSIVVRPGDVQRTITIYKFSAEPPSGPHRPQA
jgi:aldose 1-epimerase